MGNPWRIATIVSCLVLGTVATAAVAQNMRSPQRQQDRAQQAEPDRRDNGVNPFGVLKAILDAKTREDRRRKAEVERRRQEEDDAAASEQTETRTVAEPAPVPTPIQFTPMKHVPAVSKPKRHKPMRPKPKPSVPQQATPPPMQIAPTVTPALPIVPVVPQPSFHAASIAVSPAVATPPLASRGPWVLIAAIVAGAALLFGTAYAARHWLGIGAPLPTVRAFPDVGDPAAPQFDHDGPALAFLLATPAFTTTTDYPEATP